MSTNYYWKEIPKWFKENIRNLYTDEESPYLHIGKRSCAGRYCFHCGVTLCKRGTDLAHNHLADWHDTCPSCGKVVTTSTFDFTWTMFKHKDIINELLHSEILDVKKDKLIVDEYGKEFTLQEFMSEINTPIQKQMFGWWC